MPPKMGAENQEVIMVSSNLSCSLLELSKVCIDFSAKDLPIESSNPQNQDKIWIVLKIY